MRLPSPVWICLGLALPLGGAGCAPVQSRVRYVGGASPRAPTRDVGVYYAAAPAWPYRVVAEVHVTARDERAHLDVALQEALGRVREAGGHALLVRDVRTHTHLVLQSMGTGCSRFDTGVLSPGPRGPCGPVQALEVELRLEGVAVRRVRRARRADPRWPLPPPLGALAPRPDPPGAGEHAAAAGEGPGGVAGGAGGATSNPLPDLDDVLHSAP